MPMEKVKENRRVVVWGASGHALVVADILTLLDYRIEGYLDSLAPQRRNEIFGGAKVLGGFEQLPDLLNSGITLLVMGIGHNASRLSLSNVAREKGFMLPKIVHPGATIATTAELGEGVVVAAGAVVNPYCQIESNVIVNTSASIDHESIIKNSAHIAPGVRIAGGVSIGAGAFVGIGSVIKDRVSIGARTIVGAGSLVLQDIPDGVVAYGAPAKVIRHLDR